MAVAGGRHTHSVTQHISPIRLSRKTHQPDADDNEIRRPGVIYPSRMGIGRPGNDNDDVVFFINRFPSTRPWSQVKSHRSKASAGKIETPIRCNYCLVAGVDDTYLSCGLCNQLRNEHLRKVRSTIEEKKNVKIAGRPLVDVSHDAVDEDIVHKIVKLKITEQSLETDQNESQLTEQRLAEINKLQKKSMGETDKEDSSTRSQASSDTTFLRETEDEAEKEKKSKRKFFRKPSFLKRRLSPRSRLLKVNRNNYRTDSSDEKDLGDQLWHMDSGPIEDPVAFFQKVPTPKHNTKKVLEEKQMPLRRRIRRRFQDRRDRIEGDRVRGHKRIPSNVSSTGSCVSPMFTNTDVMDWNEDMWGIY